MVKLSLKFTEYLNKVLGTSNNEFSEEELSRITELSMGKDDIGSLRYFTNVTKLEFNCFPSISQKDLDEVATELPKLKELVIENQSALLTLNLEMFFYLEKLSIISNDNMSVIFNIILGLLYLHILFKKRSKKEKDEFDFEIEIEE